MDNAQLPTYTIAVARLFDEPSHAEDFEGRYRAEFKALAAVLGDEGMREEVGSAEFEACDLSALDAAFQRVKGEYEAPAERAQAERLDKVAETLAKLDLDKLARVAEMTSRPQTRQGFRRVR